MKLYKPQQLSLLTRTFENEGRTYLVLTAMLAFDPAKPNKLLHEATLWDRATKALEATPMDEAMTKLNGELLVAGAACVRGAEPQPAVSVRVKLTRSGKALVQKEVYVVGDRQWEASGMSMPVPFQRMPVSWQRAFGGEGFEPNPVGRGAKPVEEDGIKIHRLPNVEDPKHLVKASRDQPKPAALGPISPEFAARMKKSGTYDDHWLKTRYPDFAADFDWAYFQLALEDQRIEGFIEPGDSFEVTGMHPERETFAGIVPPWRTRLLVFQRGSETAREPVTRVDTLFLFPTDSMAVMIHRGVLEIEEDDAADVEAVIAGVEEIGTPRPTAHYLEVKAERDDPKYGALRSIDDGRLLPASLEVESPGEAGDTAELVELEYKMMQRQEERARRDVAQMREELLAKGFDPKQVDEACVMPPTPKRPDGSSEIVALLESTQKETEQRFQTAMAEAKQARERLVDELRAAGLPEDKATAAPVGGPPAFRAQEQLAKLREIAVLRKNAGYETPELESLAPGGSVEQALVQVEALTIEAYRKHAHMMPPTAIDPERARELRLDVLAAIAARSSLAERDLTGVDFSGCDLSGMDLRGAMLEQAKLAGVPLRGADLSNAVLAHADLSGADLTGARLAGANLGRAKLTAVIFGRGSNLTGTIFVNADLGGASLPGAIFEQAQMHESRLIGADLSGAMLKTALFLDADASQARFDHAELTDAMFVKTRLSGASFVGATLKDATLVEVEAPDCDFGSANLSGLRAVLRTSMKGGKFKGARFFRSCLRTTDLSGCDFSGAAMPEVDLSECNLQGANFYRCDLRASLLIRADLRNAILTSANLMQTLLSKARLDGTDLRGSNLFRADMAKAKGDKATRFDDAYRVQVRVVPDKTKASEKGRPA